MNFRDYLKLTESETIVEGGQGWKTYENMFKAYIDTDPKISARVKPYIKWAIQKLKKTDRIVWFLRWVRIVIAGEIDQRQQAIKAAPTLKKPIKIGASTDEIAADVNDRLKDNPMAIQQKEIAIARLNKRFGTSFSSYNLPKTPQELKTLQGQLEHFLSLPIQGIQSVQWSTQNPNQLLSEFKEMEEEWQESSAERNQITYEKGDEPEKIIDFGDGYAWFDLERPNCSVEAEAMGHCGNGNSSEGTILSLRKLVTETDGETVWYPVLTFISHDGVLGEMKGRNNDKPVPKYHKYIVALLRSDYVREIKGGGYLPEHNFKLSDLPHDEREALLKEKPDLGDVYDMWQTEGMTKRVLSRLSSALDSRDLPGYEKYEPGKDDDIGHFDDKHNHKHDGRFIVDSWKNFEQFIRNGIYDDICEKLLQVAEGEMDWQVSSDMDHKKVFADLLANLPEDIQKKIIVHSGLPHPNWVSLDEMIRKAADRLARSDDEYYQMFLHALSSEERIKDEAWERLYDYAAAGWGYASWHVYDNIPVERSAAKKKGLAEFIRFVKAGDPVYLYLSAQDIMGYASNDGDEDNSDGYDVWSLRDDSGGRADWANISWDNKNETRREQGLTIKNNEDEWLEGVDTGKTLEDEFLAALQGSKFSSKVDDPNQTEMKFDESLRRMLQMAGLLKEGFMNQQKPTPVFGKRGTELPKIPPTRRY